MNVRSLAPTILIALLLSFYCLQYDPCLMSNLEQKFKTIFQDLWHAKINYSLEKSTLLPFFNAHATNISVKPLDSQEHWHWEASSLFFLSSWVRSLFHKQLDLDVLIRDLHIFSETNIQDLAIIDHLKRIFLGIDVFPCALRTLTIQRCLLSLQDQYQQLQGSILFSSDLFQDQEQLRLLISCADGFYNYKMHNLMSNLHGHFMLQKYFENNDPLSIKSEGSFTFNMLEKEPRCTFSFTGNSLDWAGAIHNSAHSFQMRTNYQENKGITIEGSFDLSELQNAFNKLALNITGTAHFTFTINAQGPEPHTTGQINIDELYVQGKSFGATTINLSMNNDDTTKVDCIVSLKNIGLLHAIGNYDKNQKKMSLKIINDTHLSTPLSYWTIPKNNFQLNALLDYTLAGTGRTSIDISHSKIGSTVRTNGDFSFDGNTFSYTGQIGSYSLQTVLDLIPDIKLKKLIIQDKNGFVINLKEKVDSTSFDGTIDLNAVQGIILPNSWRAKSHGSAHIEGALHENQIQGNIRVDNGIIRFSSHTDNVINKLDTQFIIDFKHKRIILNDVNTVFKNGFIQSKRSTFGISEDYKPFMYVPISFEKLLLSYDKDLFSEVSGSLLLSTSDDHSSSILCQGTVNIDRGECHKNILAMQSPRSFFIPSPTTTNTSPFMCDVTIETKNPILIRTPLLKTAASAHLKLKNNLITPHLTGSIALQGGAIQFPYSDLTITKGRLYFLPHQWDNPIIEVVAEHTIKNYHVVLTITGSLKNPNLSFTSTPTLTEEQIVALLIIGIPEASLIAVVPALVMQNMKGLLFDPVQPLSKLKNTFKNLLGPLKHIKIVPSLIDKEGKNNFQGALEIDVSDKLKGIIQKNFSLAQEESKVELDYALSDAIMLRWTKDEHGDLGGEVEMCWKF